MNTRAESLQCPLEEEATPIWSLLLLLLLLEEEPQVYQRTIDLPVHIIKITLSFNVVNLGVIPRADPGCREDEGGRGGGGQGLTTDKHNNFLARRGLYGKVFHTLLY